MLWKKCGMDLREILRIGRTGYRDYSETFAVVLNYHFDAGICVFIRMGGFVYVSNITERYTIRFFMIFPGYIGHGTGNNLGN